MIEVVVAWHWLGCVVLMGDLLIACVMIMTLTYDSTQ